jgi:hypothetical protein
VFDAGEHHSRRWLACFRSIARRRGRNCGDLCLWLRSNLSGSCSGQCIADARCNQYELRSGRAVEVSRAIQLHAKRCSLIIRGHRQSFRRRISGFCWSNAGSRGTVSAQYPASENNPANTFMRHPNGRLRSNVEPDNNRRQRQFIRRGGNLRPAGAVGRSISRPLLGFATRPLSAKSELWPIGGYWKLAAASLGRVTL